MKSCKHSAWQSSTKVPVLKSVKNTCVTSGGSRGGARPLIFRPNWGPKHPPFSKGLDPPPPPPTLSQGLDPALVTNSWRLSHGYRARVACYADDTKILKSIDSITDCNALQSDLNDLVSCDWCESSGLIFNQVPVYHSQKGGPSLFICALVMLLFESRFVEIFCEKRRENTQ